MDDELTAPSYGIHFQGTIPYLHQQKNGKGVSAFGDGSGSPFFLPHARANPPHQIDLGFAGAAPSLPAGFLNNPLVDMYLPKPVLENGQAQLGYIVAEGFSCFPALSKLAALGTATDDAVRFWSRGHEWRAEIDLASTNLIPLTLIGWGPRDYDAMLRVLDLARTQKRRLIVAIDDYVPRPAGARDFTEDFCAVAEQVMPIDMADLRAVGHLFFRQYIRQLSEKISYDTAT